MAGAQRRGVAVPVVSRLFVPAVLAGSLLIGVLLGTVITSIDDAAREAAGSVESSSTPSATPLQPPRADVPGEDLDRLPRYPGSVRAGYQVYQDSRSELTAAEYLVDAIIGDVRVFYQTVIAEHGWERVDINYTDGEWAWVLVSGEDEALIEIEAQDGLIEIDLQLSRPVAVAPPPQTAPAVPVAPAPAPPDAPPPAPQPPAGDGDDDGGGDDDDDDGGGDG